MKPTLTLLTALLLAPLAALNAEPKGVAPVPGLAKLADARNVTEKDCRVECGATVPVMIAPTAEELRSLAELRTRSAALDHEIQQKADQADAEAKNASQTT